MDPKEIIQFAWEVGKTAIAVAAIVVPIARAMWTGINAKLAVLEKADIERTIILNQIKEDLSFARLERADINSQLKQHLIDDAKQFADHEARIETTEIIVLGKRRKRRQTA